MDKKLIRQLLFFSLVVCIIFVASFAYGALQKTGPDSFYDVFTKFANDVKAVALPLSGAVFAYAGARFILSGGSSEGMNAGKQALIIGTIGVLLGILAPEIVNWIKEWTAGG